MPEKPFNINRPNNEQIWACLQRCLAFEDPAARWERLSNLVAKQLRDESFKVRDIPDWPIAYQDSLFSLVYGFNNESQKEAHEISAAAMLNVVLALEDIERFTEIAFESWKVSLPATSNRDLTRAFPAASEDPEIVQLARKLKLSEAKTLWLHHAVRAVPDWTVTFNPGPWSNDSRLPFITGQLKKMMQIAPDTSGYLAARSAFVKALERQRQDLPGSFQPALILLVEGETETILLPHFAQLLGFNFSAMGVMIVSCGGAKQVARRYFELRDVVTLPIVLLVDADAGEEISVAGESLRDFDRLHVWKDGELEDTFSTPVLIQQLNIFLQASGAPGTVLLDDFPSEPRRTIILNKLWRSRGLGNFDKIGFAEVVSNRLNDKKDVPEDIVKAIKAISDARKRWQAYREQLLDSRTGAL